MKSLNYDDDPIETSKKPVTTKKKESNLEINVQESCKSDKSLEPKTTKPKYSLINDLTNRFKSVPAMIGCTYISYLFEFQGCVDEINTRLGEGPHVGFHIASGAGIYGGFTKDPNKTLTSLIGLGASLIPDTILLTQLDDTKQVVAYAGLKVAGYGVGYVAGTLGRFFCGD
jgi:hypothetical protein